MIKTLVIDDSALVRSIIKDFLESDGSFRVIGEAENGREGIEMARLLNPDLITMDIEMPVMNGLEATAEIRRFLSTPIVVISTNDTATTAYEAAVKGALEFYAKDNFTAHTSPAKRTQILETLKNISGIKGRLPAPAPSGNPDKSIRKRIVSAVLIAASTGGPKSLCRLCADIPAGFPVPIILVQHNSSGFDKGFVLWLNTYTPLEVKLAGKGEQPEKGKLYVAPTDRHLLLGPGGFVLDDGEMVNNQKPAADLLFSSAASYLKSGVISVVLTGMGADGAEGTRAVHREGGITIAQDEATSMIYGMPKAAFDTGCVDMVLPLEKIPSRLAQLTEQRD